LGGIAPPGGFRGRLSLTDPELTAPEPTEATP
jgi:hypothetical protein